MKSNSQILIFATFVFFAGAARGEDWPQFRGPTGQGISSEVGLPIEWSATTNVAWKQAIPGTGWSSPVVVGRRIYLTTAVQPAKGPAGDLSLEALCLDAETGKVLWQQAAIELKKADVTRVHSKNSHASASPLIHDGRLYVHFGPEGTACLDLSGKVLWRNTSLKYAAVHGNGGSPIAVHDLIVFSCDGMDQRMVVALESATGKVRWKTPRTGNCVRRFSFSTPLLLSANGREQIISSGSDVVSALEPETGKEIWRVRYTGYSVVPRPVFGQGLVFVCTGFDAPGLVVIRPDGQGDVTATKVAWKATKGASLTPSPLLLDDKLFMIADNGVASCFDAKTGHVNWQERIGGNYSASPILAEGRIYCVSEDGICTVLRAGQKFEKLARNKLDERTLASPAAADGALFIRTEKNLYRIAGQAR
jgi:outer membrane protein assembly factor BamB